MSDGARAYWVVEPSGEGGVDMQRLAMREGKPTADSVILRQGLSRTVSLATDGAYVYLGNDRGEVSRVATALDNAPEIVTRVGDPSRVVRAVAVDESFVYFATGTATSNGPVDVFRAKKCGGRARLIAKSYMFGDDIVAAGRYLYLSGASALARVPK